MAAFGVMELVVGLGVLFVVVGVIVLIVVAGRRKRDVPRRQSDER